MMPVFAKRRQEAAPRPPGQMLALEPRYLFDAAAVTTTADATTDTTSNDSTATSTQDTKEDSAVALVAAIEPAATDLVDDQQAPIQIPENSFASRPIGIISTIVDSSTVTFELVAQHPDGTPSTSLTAFSVDPNTGAITIANSSEIDYESSALTNNSFTLFVKVTETAAPENVDYTEVTIELLDRNDRPILEPISDQSIVGDGTHLLEVEIFANDQDGDPIAYSLQQAPDGAEIVTEGDSVFFRWTPDEGDPDATVIIRANDPEVASLSDTTEFMVTVTDHADLVDDQQAPIQIPENSFASRPIGIISTIVDSSTVTFELVDQHPDGTPSTSLTAFSVDPNTGAITIANSSEIDYESSALTNNSFTLFVKVTETAYPDNVDYTEVTIELLDRNDRPILEPISDQSVVGDGTHLLEVEIFANDQDGDPIAYSLQQAPDGAEIVTEGGSVFFRWTPNEGDPDATVIIRANDPEVASLSDTTEFMVTVTDPAAGINEGTDTGTGANTGSQASSSSGPQGTVELKSEQRIVTLEEPANGDSTSTETSGGETSGGETSDESGELSAKQIAETETFIASVDFSTETPAPAAGPESGSGTPVDAPPPPKLIEEIVLMVRNCGV